MNYLLSTENLCWTYPDGTVGIDAVYLDVSADESVGIVGPNGAGKTTLVNHLNGFFIPQKGTLTIKETQLSKKTREFIRQRVGVVFQNADDQLFMPSVREDIAFGPANQGLGREQIDSRVEQVALVLGISNLLDRPSYRLSQGQKRFAALGTVLAMKPDLLVFDEPTADLDPGNRRKLITLLKGLFGTRIIVSHDLDFIWDTCKRTLIMDGGRIVADDLTTNVLSNEDLLNSHGLELPLRLQKIT